MKRTAPLSCRCFHPRWRAPPGVAGRTLRPSPSDRAPLTRCASTSSRSSRMRREEDLFVAVLMFAPDSRDDLIVSRSRTRPEAHQEQVMKLITTFGLGLFLFSCGDGGPHTIPQANACPEVSRAMCAKLFSCDDVISAVARTALGGTQASCETRITQSACSVSWCQPNQSYHGDKAYECRQQVATAGCGTLDVTALTGNIASALATISACAQVCTADDTPSIPGG
jgi:hypothetical protein